jgi:hypothetical protein
MNWNDGEVSMVTVTATAVRVTGTVTVTGTVPGRPAASG